MHESKQWLTVIKFFRLYFIDSLKEKAIVNIFFWYYYKLAFKWLALHKDFKNAGQLN